MGHLRALALWAYARRELFLALYARGRTWAIRIGSFYAGFKILHHEIYESTSAEPILVFLGLWLCGIAPATFFDQLRRIGVSLQSELDKQTEDVRKGIPKAEVEATNKTEEGDKS